MGENSSIEWTTHTFNTHVGCTKCSAGCAFCYAERDMDKRLGFAQWGLNGTRVLTSDANWRKPMAWDREAKAAGERHRVFCASLADVFEQWDGPIVDSKGRELNWSGQPLGDPASDLHAKAMTMDHVRARLFGVIADTPNLDWLLLTKRPESIMASIERASRVCGAPLCDTLMHWTEYGEFPPNVWVGTSVENQEAADERIPHLLKVPAAVRFLSMEPLLGPVDLGAWLDPTGTCCGGEPEYTCSNCPARTNFVHDRDDLGTPVIGIDWVIAGGESGPKARPMHSQWARDIRDQCQASGTPYLFKQWGRWEPYGDVTSESYSPVDAMRWVGPDGSMSAENVRPTPEHVLMQPVGKKAAGRKLDGRTWDQFPITPPEPTNAPL